MLIGVISDTHGNLSGWQRAWDLGLADADVILHCGDILYHAPKNKPVEGYAPMDLAHALSACTQPVLIARGNCDSEVDQGVLDVPIQWPCAYTVIEGVRILATHGDLIPPDDLAAHIDRWRLDFLLTGHTHTPVLRRLGSGIHINPGSATYPLAQDQALHPRTFALIRDGVPTVLDLDTGEPLLTP
jgi:hypothetical protein